MQQHKTFPVIPFRASRTRRGVPAALAVLLAQAWTAASAADSTLPSSASSAAMLEAVEVRGSAVGSYTPEPDAGVTRTDAPIMEIPQAVVSVPAQVMSDQRPQNLDDALGNISGITQANTLGGTEDSFIKRGFGDNRDWSVFQNGMPIVQGRVLNATADHVEVLKGPSSVLYGIMDPGGAVNVISKQPQLTPRTELSVGGSTYGAGKNGGDVTLDSTGAVANTRLAYRLIADFTNEAYWRNFGTHREALIAPSLAWLGNDTQITASYQHRNFLYPFDRGTALDPATLKPLGIPADRRLDAYNNDMWGESRLFQLSADHRFNGMWSGHVGYSDNHETYDANQMQISGVNTAAGTLTRRNNGTFGADSFDRYFTASLAGKFDVAGMRNELTFGTDLEHRKIYRADLTRDAATCTFSYINPVYDCEPQTSTVSASDSDQTDNYRGMGIWAQDSLHLSDKWILVGGLRYQRWGEQAGKGRPFKANTDTSGGKLLPKLGVVYKWNDALSLYASYTESLKPSMSIAALAGGVVIDSAMQPEQSRSWEVGAKWDMAQGLSSTLALFDIRKRNVLASQYDATLGQNVARAVGAVRSRGIEFDMTGRISPRWSAIASYAYTDAVVTRDPLYAGWAVAQAARHTASLNLAYDAGRVAGGNLRIGGGARYVGVRSGELGAPYFTLPAYTVFNAFATYETKIGGHKTRFQLNVNNLLNRVYYTSSVNPYFVALGTSRQIMLRTTFEL